MCFSINSILIKLHLQTLQKILVNGEMQMTSSLGHVYWTRIRERAAYLFKLVPSANCISYDKYVQINR